MSIETFVTMLTRLGVELRVEGKVLLLDAPRGVLTRSIRAELRARKAELIAYLRRPTRPETLPLSFSQQRLWFLDQFGQGHLYHVRSAWRIEAGSEASGGALNLTALQWALDEILRRHESLHTTFRQVEGTAQQVIHPPRAVALPVIDLQHQDLETQALSVAYWIDQEGSIPFDLTSDLMLRGRVLQLDQQTAILLLTMHHIASDAWSLSVLMRELSTYYAAFIADEVSPLPDLLLQYADFALWQRETEQEKRIAQQLSYWEHQLAGAPPLLQLPTDRPRPAVESIHGHQVPISISAALTQQLRRLGQQSKATLFMTLLAAFQVLLARYSGQNDIVVGTPTANRTHKAVEGLIGFFVNTLVLRTDLSDDPTFLDLLTRVRQMALQAYKHQDVPFERLVEALQPERNLGYNPLVQVVFALRNTPRHHLKLSGLSVSELEIARPLHLDLEVHLWEEGEGLSGYCTYNTDLFERTTIERMVGHFQTLLAGIAANPQQPIGTLPLLTEAERQQILIEWNDTATDYPKDKCIHQLFEMQVKYTPNAVAVVFPAQFRPHACVRQRLRTGEHSLTYRDLNARANQLAHHLQSLGVGPDVLVGICVERSLEMVVGVLAILKAGGAYVPLDPAYPQERLAFMLQDADVSVLLTEERLRDSLPLTSTQIVSLDGDSSRIAIQSHENPAKQVAPHHLAYVLYTSGSTGRPKGVMIEHRSPTALICWGQRVYSQLELAGVLASTSVCFDLSVYEIFLPLSVGGKVILAENALHLPEMRYKEQVTLINTVPSAMEELVRRQAIPSSVQTINLAGEPLRQELVDKLYAIPTIQKVYDLYGPSEDTTYSTFKLREQGGPVTIGKPLDNTQAYILDATLQPLPVGVPGELHLGGVGLSRGYLNRPQLTAEKFIPNPFGCGGRLYKTGDLTRYLPDGNIEFLGRIDHQVKIRGFRIELGEIESALSQHPTVRDRVVVPRTYQEHKELVAYIVPAEQASREELIPALRTHLKRSLPDYMIPSAFVLLDHLPLTPNGKIDRKALPAPERGGDESRYIPPSTPTEETVAAIWSEVLGLEQVGIHDNFFALGGHSLLVTQVTSRVASTFGLNLPVRALFESPTIAELAERISDDQLVLALQGMSRGTGDQSATFSKDSSFSNASSSAMGTQEEEEEEEEFVL